MNSAKYAKEIAPVKLNVRAQWKEAFRLLVSVSNNQVI
jgi:hypothetical protein